MVEEIKCKICNRPFKDTEGLTMHNTTKHPELIKKPKKQLPVKKIRNWVIFIVIIALVVFGITSLIKNNSTEKIIINENDLNFEIPKGTIHWHPHLTIRIDEETIPIPQNIGITSTIHYPMHTHDAGGTIHIENDRPTKKALVLGYLFEIWGKQFNKDCIFEYCTNKGTLKMYVNGKENFDFEKYFMQDGDEILIEYVSKVN